MQYLQERFDPVLSINSGQVFLWEKRGDSWYGINGEHVVKIAHYDARARLTSFTDDSSSVHGMFRLGDDMKSIFSEISRDPLVSSLIKMYPGLRLMRQEAHQCLFSFLCASNTNIPMIRRMLSNLTRKFGKPVMIDGLEFFTFPSAGEINKASLDQLRACGLGYRVKAVKMAAEAIVSGQLDFETLKKADYEKAKEELLKLYGVGNKIADCVLLFSLEKLEAFPIDVWIARALSSHYSWLHKNKLGTKVTPHQYELLANSIQNYFGRYAGYAQQYLYYHMRQTARKKW